jgi:hypothetical protein
MLVIKRLNYKSKSSLIRGHPSANLLGRIINAVTYSLPRGHDAAQFEAAGIAMASGSASRCVGWKEG